MVGILLLACSVAVTCPETNLCCAVCRLPAFPLTLIQSPTSEQQAKARLAVVLREWEKAEAGVRDCQGDIRVTKEDYAWRETRVQHHKVLAKRPNLLRVEIRDDKNQPIELWVCTGKEARMFKFKERTEFIFELPDD